MFANAGQKAGPNWLSQKKRFFSRRIFFYFYGQRRALKKVVYRDKFDKLAKLKQM